MPKSRGIRVPPTAGADAPAAAVTVTVTVGRIDADQRQARLEDRRRLEIVGADAEAGHVEADREGGRVDPVEVRDRTGDRDEDAAGRERVVEARLAAVQDEGRVVGPGAGLRPS